MTDDNTRGREPMIPHGVLRIAVWFLGVVALAMVAWLMTSRPVPVKTVRPQRGELVVEVFGTGTLESKVVVGVSSKIVGKVVEVSVDQGDIVTAGRTLARLEAKDFRDAVGVAVAQRDQAQAELAKAKADVERERPLLANDSVAKAEVAALESAYSVAQAKLTNAEAALGVAEAKLADTQIVSPASGLVITRNLEVGSTVVPGAPIFRIAVSVPWVVTQVDERQTGALRLGQPARVVFETDPAVMQPGHVTRLAAEVDRVTEEREVDVSLDRPSANQFLGQRADVYIETARKQDAPRLPLTTLVIQGGRPGVLVVVEGRTRWRSVQLGLRDRQLVEVVSGVTERDLVITNPLAGKKPVSDRERVTVIPEKTEEP
ncbi:MAG TPA: efflux RND transporter periplasmic adaptor subunit [Solirubrobacteraceae bacterium]